ncbi:phytase [Microvirga aerilata]|uniref:phytase n=1 Tax=Microvirga aerilata TaxID=670292 RepID=UPI003645BE77
MAIANPPAGQLGMATPFGELLGASTAELEAEMADYASMGVDWVRIDFWWRDIQWAAADGPYNWGNHDKVVAAANKYGIKVIAELQGVPSWAKATGGMANDANIKLYADFAKAAVEHFKGKVQHWEIWNEPNLTMYWGAYPNAADYTKALKAAYTAIKAADPNSFVISGGLSPSPESGGSWYGAVEFVKQMYANGAKGYFDALGFHPYSWPLMPDDPAAWNGWQIMETGIRGAMVAAGDGDKKIWMTEMGAPTTGPNAVSQQKQAEMIKQAVDLAKGYDWAGPLMWYSYKDRGGSTGDTENYFGMLGPNGERKASYNTFKTLALADDGDAVHSEPAAPEASPVGQVTPAPAPSPAPTSNVPFTGTVNKTAETGTVMGSGDVADDPAIWVNPADASKSLIIGTSKASNGGLVVWDMAGREVSRFVANDPYNNVDVSGNLVGVSNRDTKAMDFFASTQAASSPRWDRSPAA